MFSWWNKNDIISKYAVIRLSVIVVLFCSRYFLYYWPLTSAIFGISLNFFLLSMVAILSWLQLFWNGSETKNEVVKLFKGRGKPSSKKKSGIYCKPTFLPPFIFAFLSSCKFLRTAELDYSRIMYNMSLWTFLRQFIFANFSFS